MATKPKVKEHISESDVLDSAWAELRATGVRPRAFLNRHSQTIANTEPILHGKLAGSGLNWTQINFAIQNGIGGFPKKGTPEHRYSSLSDLMNQHQIPENMMRELAEPVVNLP